MSISESKILNYEKLRLPCSLCVYIISGLITFGKLLLLKVKRDCLRISGEVLSRQWILGIRDLLGETQSS
jgi:hypothetical protein